MTTLDVSEYDDAGELASDLQELIREAAEVLGQDPKLEVSLLEKEDKYVLYWEGGPWEWAPDFTGGENIMGAQLTGITRNSGVWLECKNSFALVMGEY